MKAGTHKIISKSLSGVGVGLAIDSRLATEFQSLDI